MASFKELEIFKESVSLVKMVYELTKSFPSTERFGLVSQIRRAAISVSSNIAEGSSRRTINDKKRFLDIAIGSLSEIHAQLIISRELDFINNEQLNEFENKVDNLRPRLIVFQRAIKTRPKPSNSQPPTPNS